MLQAHEKSLQDWKLQQLAEKIKHDAQTGRAGQFFNVVTQKWEWPMPDNNGVRKLEYTGPVPAVPKLTVPDAALSMVERNWIPNASTATHWLINEIGQAQASDPIPRE